MKWTNVVLNTGQIELILVANGLNFRYCSGSFAFYCGLVILCVWIFAKSTHLNVGYSFQAPAVVEPLLKNPWTAESSKIPKRNSTLFVSFLYRQIPQFSVSTVLKTAWVFAVCTAWHGEKNAHTTHSSQYCRQFLAFCKWQNSNNRNKSNRIVKPDKQTHTLKQSITLGFFLSCKRKPSTALYQTNKRALLDIGLGRN